MGKILNDMNTHAFDTGKYSLAYVAQSQTLLLSDRSTKELIASLQMRDGRWSNGGERFGITPQVVKDLGNVARSLSVPQAIPQEHCESTGSSRFAGLSSSVESKTTQAVDTGLEP